MDNRSFSPVMATLGYVLSEDRSQVLLLHRNLRTADYHFGKYNGLGGKLPSDEDVVSGMRREVQEESGLECREMVLRGTISWPGFGQNREDWYGFIFLITGWSGEPRSDCAEGSLSWVDVDRILDLPLWEGDRHFLPLVFSEDPRQFHGVMPYEDGRPVRWQFSWLPVAIP